jgi:hypothetical protein
MSEENFEELPVDRPPRVSDGFNSDFDYFDFIFWAGLIFLIALLIWGRFCYT